VDDLVSKYFREDLTEAEDQALEGKLLASSEASLAFAAASEEAYQRYGLPEPQWPGNPDDFPRPRSKGKIGLWLFVLLAGSAGAAFWVYQERLRPEILSSGRTGFFSIPWFFSHSKGAHPGPQAEDRAKIKMIPSKLNISFLSTPMKPSGEEGDAGAMAENSSDKVVFSDGTPSTTPIDVTGQPGRRGHSDLEVVIHWPKTGQVTVRILSLDGTKEILLYQGLLQRGKWAFDWDGRLADGHTAPPGSYHILVEAGPVTQSSTIVIPRSN
jgi:hypothetical protein